jgi:transcriptional regulator with XRE-family HTH domain
MPSGLSHDVKRRFGESIRFHRHRCGLTQQKLALRADLNRTYISDVERGGRNLSLDAMHRLATAMGVPLANLFRDPQDATPPSEAKPPIRD